MPPKRALAMADSNAEASAPKAKKSRNLTADEEDESHDSHEGVDEWLTDEDSSDDFGSDDFSDSELEAERTGVAKPKPQPFDYYCIPRPLHDVVAENAGKPVESQIDQGELEEQYDAELRKLVGKRPKPAAESPENHWIAMWETWTIFTDWQRKGTYRCPDLFEMYIYNDFYSYGLQELVENLLLAFDAEFKKKDHDEAVLKHMWANAAATVHWLLSDEDSGPWQMIDDGARYETTVGLVARMFLATLHELDRGNLLKVDSPIKDLALVMSLYMTFGIDHDQTIKDDVAELPKHILSYARKAGIDLAEPSGRYGTKGIIESIEEEFGVVGPIRASTVADKWKWKSNFNAYKKQYKKVGGEEYNILFFSRAKRAKYSFNKKDPLRNVPEKDLEREMILLK